MVLIDTGCQVHGYQSDITRSYVFGTPSARQREFWGMERDAQLAAFEAARLGQPCEAVDAAARRSLEANGLGRTTACLACRTAPGMASAWTSTKARTWCVAIARRWMSACASATNR